MTASWDVCLLAPAGTASCTPISTFRPEETEFATRSVLADALNQFVATSQHEWLVFLAESAAEAFRAHSAQIHTAFSGRSKGSVLLVSLDGVVSQDLHEEASIPRGDAGNAVKLPRTLAGLFGIWKRFSPSIAARIESPERRAAICFRRETFREDSAFRDVSSPLWDWLLRQSVAGRPIEVLDEIESGSARTFLSIDSRNLPALQPKKPGPEQRWLKEHLHSFEIAGLSSKARSQPEAVAFHAGVFQFHDFLAESHELSQSIEGEGKHQSGDYWHAIMHRREPDASNAKYWFRHVGRPPMFGPLAEMADAVLVANPSRETESWQSRLCTARGWEPLAFIDLCEECRGAKGHPLKAVSRGIQWAEMLLLLEQTYQDALTST